MSELTRCNHCTLEDLKARHPDSAVYVLPDEDNPPWLAVFIDSEPAGHWFLALTEECAC